MLGTTPPGYSPAAMNAQRSPMLARPGVQALGVSPLVASQGRLGTSSYTLPSSYGAMPSSIPYGALNPQQGAGQQPGSPLGASNMQAILRALRGAQ